LSRFAFFAASRARTRSRAAAAGANAAGVGTAAAAAAAVGDARARTGGFGLDTLACPAAAVTSGDDGVDIATAAMRR
jgi:hypothetical protein